MSELLFNVHNIRTNHNTALTPHIQILWYIRQLRVLLQSTNIMKSMIIRARLVWLKPCEQI